MTERIKWSLNCVLCGRPLTIQAKPYWVIDPNTLEIKGLAHSTCRNKLRWTSIENDFTVAAEGLYAKPPSLSVIEFSAKMIQYRKSLPNWEIHEDLLIVILLGQTFEASNVEEFLTSPRRKELFDWWTSPENQDRISNEALEQIKTRLREALK